MGACCIIAFWLPKIGLLVCPSLKTQVEAATDAGMAEPHDQAMVIGIFGFIQHTHTHTHTHTHAK